MLLDHCPSAVNAYDQMNVGRLFAAFIQGNNKQRYFIEVELKDDWFLSSDRLPWKVFIGCTQGHSTGIVRPIRELSPVDFDRTSSPWLDFSCDRSQVCELYF